MAVKKILTIGKHEKILRSKSEPVSKINREIKALFQDLRDTMEDRGNAIGLAAPQIGVLKRVVAVRLGYYDDQPDEEQQPPIMLVNPEIIEEEGSERGHDACLSIPGMMGYTDRRFKIRVRYLDEQGHKQERVFEGWDARVVQHEIDHLDGILFIDRERSVPEDLYVLVETEEGKLEPVPYLEMRKKALQAINPKSALPETVKLR